MLCERGVSGVMERVYMVEEVIHGELVVPLGDERVLV